MRRRSLLLVRHPSRGAESIPDRERVSPRCAADLAHRGARSRATDPSTPAPKPRPGDALALVQRAHAEARAGAVGMSSDELVDLVAEAQRVASAAGAVQGVRMAQFAARGQVQDPESGALVERDFGVGHVHEFAGTEIGAALGLSPGSADRRVDVAAVWARKLPATLAAMAAGGFDPWRATVVADELRDASPEICARVEEIVFPDITGDTPAAARARVRRALARVDPDAVRAKAAKARLERGVR